MMPSNGFIKTNTKTGGGFSDSGDAIPVIDVWSEKITCRVQVNTYNKRGKYKDGQFVQCSYTIFVQGRIITDRIMLYYNGSEVEYTIQSADYLPMIGKTQITV